MNTPLCSLLALFSFAVVVSAAEIVVANNHDSGTGSLRQAILNAAASPGPDTITFDAALNGGTISLTTAPMDSSAFTITDQAGVTLDASALPAGLTLDGGNRGFRLAFLESGGVLTLRSLTFANWGGSNFFADGAVVLNDFACALTIERCTFSDNRTAGATGGALGTGGLTTLTHCTFSGNQAAYDGGAIANVGILSVTHCTFAGNSAGRDGGAMTNSSNGALTMKNSLIAGNSASSAGPDLKNSGTLTLSGVNFVGDLSGTGQSASATLLTGDAKLIPLANHGGGTKTILPLPGSPALDAVPAGSEVAGLDTDQRGFPRLADADGNGTLLADLGAVEVRRVVVNTRADELDTPTGAQTSLREALRDDAATASADHIGFDPAVFTATLRTINLAPEKGTMEIPNGVVVDATDLPKGVTINGVSKSFRLFFVPVGGNLTMRGLTLIRGGGISGDEGGAISNWDTVRLERCTLSENRATNQGGAIMNSGLMTLSQCTLSGNQTIVGPGGGAAIANIGILTLTHCTLSGNQTGSGGSGGAILTASRSAVNLSQTLIAGNTATSDPDISGSNLNFTGANFIGTFVSGPLATGPAPLTGNAMLDPAGLADNGGPARTIALLPDSRAIDAATGSSITSDQRGQPIFGSRPDIGAFEAQAPILAEIAVTGPSDQNLHNGVETVDYGAVDVGLQMNGTFTIANLGLSTLTLDGTPKVAVGGANADDFVVTIQPASTVNANDSTSFTVDFAPKALGVRTATLSIASNDPSENPFTIKLQGTGQDTFTVSPILESPQDGARIFPTFTLAFFLTEAAKSGTLKLLIKDGASTIEFPLGAANETIGAHTMTFDATTLALGDYALELVCQDLADHQAEFSVPSRVTIRSLNPVSTQTLSTGGAAPGRLASADLPDDAVIGSFGVPATDDDGDVAFLAKWTGTIGGKASRGSGLFTRTDCLGVVGGDSVIAGAKWKSFTDPVVEGGSVLTIAGLSGSVAKGAASGVFANFSTPNTLELIARAGDIAPDKNGAQPSDGAVFKSFKAVAIDGTSVGIFAQLTGGTGTDRATSANNTGLWIKQGSNSLQLALRKGQMVGGKKITKLVTFAPGAGSPGQGRGWVVERPSSASVLALVTFDDQTQGVLAVNAGGAIINLSKTGALATSGGPSIMNATFASYSFPATNADLTTAFLASLKVGDGGVKKADARGIFLSNATGTSYTPFARVSQTAIGTGTSFSVLKDPVLASNGAFAFPATLKPTRTVRGPATQTLWWRPAGGALTLLAQGGGAASDLSGPKWKAFTSLAIAADRGPIFTATLTPAATGVWACDYSHAPRLLFQTGSQLDVGTPGTPVVKTVKSFELLSAAVGTSGVTRSFNDNAQVVWLATFMDKSQAIVTTEVP